MKISITRLSLAICLSLGLCFWATGQARAYDAGYLMAEKGETLDKIKKVIEKKIKRDGDFRRDGERRGDRGHKREDYRRDELRHDRDDNFRHDRRERDHFGDRRGPDSDRDRHDMGRGPDRDRRPDMDRPFRRPGRP